MLSNPITWFVLGLVNTVLASLFIRDRKFGWAGNCVFLAVVSVVMLAASFLNPSLA
jgi:hypothetical protein